MASPFAVFRRNQKVLTVILTCLAMFAFIILDSVSKMETSAIMPIIFGLIGAALAWMWGSQNERGISYPTICVGAVLGGIAGAMIVAQSGNQGGISTAHGRLSNRDIFEMKQKRDIANQFIVSAFRERKEEVHPMMANYYLNQYRFGDTSSRSVVTKLLLEKEADALGIEISDEFITDYIKTISDNSMTRKALTTIRGQLGIGESELYDLLRSELRARVASRVLNPELVHMPDQYWGDFEKLNVRHSIDAVAIPVEPFAARLPKPSDQEINEVFEAFKGVYPMGENPGFVQPDRLQLAWFESNYEAAEALVGEIPEEELKARYEERKETEYKIETLPDLDAGFDDGAPKFGEPPAPVKTGTPDADGGSTDDAAGTDDSTPEEKPAEQPGDDAPASDDSAGKDETPDDSSDTEPEPEECGDGDDQEDDTSTEESPKDEQPEPAAEEKTTEESAPAEDAKPAATDDAAAESDDALKADSEETEAPDLSEVKYRSFEEVRDEIRDLMLREKTEALIEEQISAAISAVKEWRFNLREENPEKVEEAPDAREDSAEYQNYLVRVKKDHEEYNAYLAAGIAAKAEAYAKENGLVFVAPEEFLSQQELIEHQEYKLGTAREPSDPTDFMAQPQTAAARLFTGATTLFIPEEAQGQFDDTRYAFWATGEKEQHIPTLDEPGVREEVEQAVRIRNARPEAEARAKELAEALSAKLADSSIASIAEGIAGQTTLGEAAAAKSDSDNDDSTDSASAEADDTAAEEPEEEKSCDDEEADETDADDDAEAEGETEVEDSAPADGEADDDEGTEEEVSDQALSVISSPPFTWYRQSSQGMQMNPFAQPTLEFGFVPGIDGVDNDFMKAVSEAAVGDVVVIPNMTKQVYYIVHVKARNPSGADDPGLTPVRQQFITENVPMSQIYGQLANSQGSEVYQAWQADFFAKHNVNIEELDSI